MNPDARTVVLNNATSQRARRRAALAPDYAKADDRSFTELLAFAARFGALIKYYDFENTHRGNWKQFFAHDPLLAMASMATIDVAGMGRDVGRLARLAREEGTDESRRALLEAALELPRQVNAWLDATSKHDGSATARGVHTRLAADIREQPGSQVSLFQADLMNDAAVEDIVAAWRPIADAVKRWAAEAPRHIARALREDAGQQQPHVALFIAFVRLLRTAQKSINAFSSRRTDFYFRQVLRETNRLPLPDSVYVAFEAARSPASLGVTVPRHTLLSAGKDALGQDLQYASCDDVTVTDARLAMVRTVRAVSGPLLARRTDHVLERVVSRELTRDEANAGGFATFGDVDDRPATVGFAVASASLSLRGGKRNITLEVCCAKVRPATDEVLESLNLATGLDNDFILDALLRQAFTLSVSTAKGWLEVPTYTVELVPGRGGPAFRLCCELGPDVPPIAPCPHLPPASAVPALRAQLRQERVRLGEGRRAQSVYPLSVLAELAVVSLDVHVSVSGLAPAGVENPNGVVDTTRPFPAFGAVPIVRHDVRPYLRIRDSELFAKDLSRLALRITWFDLPANDDGFQGYYRGYVIGPNGLPQKRLFDNQVFKVAVVVEPGGTSAAAPQDDEQQRFLFRTVPERPGAIPEADRRLSRWTILEELPIAPAPVTAKSGQSGDGLRVELAAPAYAFGHTLYESNMRHGAVASRTMSVCEASCQADYAFLRHAAQSLENVLPPFLQPPPAQPPSPQEREWDRFTRDGVWGRFARTWWRVVDATRSFRGLRTRMQTVDARTTAALGMLATAAYESLSSCLTAWKERFSEQQVLALRTQLADCRTGTPLERLADARRLGAALRAAAAAVGMDPASPHLGRSELALRAASWVEDCIAGYSNESEWRYRRTVRVNLTRCIRQLTAEHDAAVKVCIEKCMSRETGQPMPNPPYVPQVEALSLDYTASDRPTSFAHLLPFEGHRQVDTSGADAPTLLPNFAYAGNLYLGFAQLNAPQALPLYLRMAQGSGAAPPNINWAYLSGNRWLSLQTPPTRGDATHALQTSGIMTLMLPERSEAGASSVLPGEFQWLRAAAIERPGDVPRMMGIYTHAVKATRTGTADDDNVVPAGRVKGLAKPIKGIASVTQPSASFGGRGRETDRAFQRRVSERLRHKERAILAWDYEHLVLEQFPAMWKVRTLPARARRAGERGGGPGWVRVIVVPGHSSLDVTDPTAPTSSAATLARIAESLQAAASPFVRVQVLNPIYVRIRVTATLTWRDRADPRVSAERLNDDIKAYLSPWGSAVQGDRGVSEPEIAEFVQSREYVDGLTSIAFAYDPANTLAADPEACFLTTATAHEIHDEVAVGASHEDGY